MGADNLQQQTPATRLLRSCAAADGAPPAKANQPPHDPLTPSLLSPLPCQQPRHAASSLLRCTGSPGGLWGAGAPSNPLAAAGGCLFASWAPRLLGLGGAGTAVDRCSPQPSPSRCCRCHYNNIYPASLASTRPGQGVVGHQPAFRDFHPAGHHPPTANTPGDLGSSIRVTPTGEKRMVADPRCSFQAQTTSRWSAHWRFAFKPAPAGRGVLGLAPVRVTRSCSAAEAGPRLSQ